MKRDMDLIREILIEIGAQNDWPATAMITSEDAGKRYHLHRLLETRLAEGKEHLFSRKVLSADRYSESRPAESLLGLTGKSRSFGASNGCTFFINHQMRVPVTLSLHGNHIGLAEINSLVTDSRPK